jgi:hypothetical protein
MKEARARENLRRQRKKKYEDSKSGLSKIPESDTEKEGSLTESGSTRSQSTIKSSRQKELEEPVPVPDKPKREEKD